MGLHKMEKTKEIFKTSIEYTKAFLKWVVVATLVGIAGGVVGSAFHKCLDFVTKFRMDNTYITYFMPVGVVIIIAMYSIFSKKEKLDINLVITSVKEGEKIPFVLVPLIFIATSVTQFFGGSAGREGAALQIGGGIGYNLGKLFRLEKNDIRLITMAGMSSVFTALFGTPLTAAVFSLEVARVGAFNLTGLMPCVVASAVTSVVSAFFGVKETVISDMVIEDTTTLMFCKVIILAILCALVGTLFLYAIKKSEKIMKKLFKNPYLRGVVGALIVVLLTVLSGTFDYNGAGMNIVERALSGEARTYDFIMKIIFTAITIAAGFKGGEIVPAFFVGSTFGCIIGPLLGINGALSAAIGMVVVFCGVVNCPLASIILSIEMFGTDNLLLFAIACGVGYMMSGHTGLYKSQDILYSKLTADVVE